MTFKRTSGTSEQVFKIIFFGVFIFSLLLGICLTSMVNSVSENYNTKIEYINKWRVVDEAGKSIKTGKLYYDNRAYAQKFTIISKLPDEVWHDSVLCFMNRSNVEVYINGKLRKSFDRVNDTGLPCGSMKEFYIIVPLIPADAGAELRIERYPTDWNPMVVSETFVTSYEGVYGFMVNKYGMAFALISTLFIASLLATVIGIFLHIWNKHTMDMIYASLGILDVACWLISVSQLTPYITGLYFVDGIMGFLFCLMMPFSLLIYINLIQKNRYKKLYRVLFIISLLNFTLFTALNFTGIKLFQSSLVYIDSVLGLVLVSVLVTFIIDIRNGRIKDYPYTAIGFLIFIFMGFTEIIILIFFETISNEIPMLIGLMGLLIMVVIQQIDDIRKVRRELEKEVNAKTEENEQLLIHIVRTLAGTIDAKDTYTNGHSSRVADYSREIARRFGYNESQLNDIYMMGLLHDIGKIGIPDAVINKPEKLTNEEYELIKNHPVMGSKILSNIKEKPEFAVGARWHHEKYGGDGYPDGIKAEEIPEPARIIAVADAYDAMTSYRSYRDPMQQEKVMQEIAKGSGTQFDPRFAEIMLEMMAEDTRYDLREKKRVTTTTRLI